MKRNARYLWSISLQSMVTDVVLLGDEKHFPTNIFGYLDHFAIGWRIERSAAAATIISSCDFTSGIHKALSWSIDRGLKMRRNIWGRMTEKNANISSRWTFLRNMFHRKCSHKQDIYIFANVITPNWRLLRKMQGSKVLHYFF